MIVILLNGVWSLCALCAALLSIPRQLQIHRKPFAVIIYVRSFWWKLSRGVRATTAGSVVLCGPNLQHHDLEHELVHVKQYYREPFIHPFLYLYQSLRYGYRNNKYEREAYLEARNSYIAK